MVSLSGGILNGGKDVFPFQERVVRKDLFVGGSRCQQIEDVRDANAKAADARPSSALSLFNRDPLQAFDAHRLRVYAIRRVVATRLWPVDCFGEAATRL
jgi:hypothetical protein